MSDLIKMLKFTQNEVDELKEKIYNLKKRKKRTKTLLVTSWTLIIHAKIKFATLRTDQIIKNIIIGAKTEN